MDLEQLSDEELKKIASGGAAPSASVDLENLDDETLKQIAQGQHLEDPGFFQKIGEGALNAVTKVGQFVDSYTGAPTRAAIGAVEDARNPFSAFANQFGGDPSKAPTGKELATKAGASTEDFIPISGAMGNSFALTPDEQAVPDEEKIKVSPAGIMGLGVDMAADPTNLLPLVAGSKLLRSAGKAASPLMRTAAEAAGNVVTKGLRAVPGGGAVIKGGEIVADTSRATKQALEYMFKPKQAEDFGSMVQIAQKNGIDPKLLPESIEFGHDSVISRGSRALREGPTGQAMRETFHEFHDAVQEATNSQIKKISGGAILSEPEAGQVIRQGYDDAVDRLFKDVDFTYSEVIRAAPGIRLSPASMETVESKLRGLSGWAQGQLRRGITATEKGQAQQILNAVDAVREGSGSLKQTYEAMSQIGRHAFKTAKNSLADVPVDVEKFRDLYFTLRDEFTNSTAKYLGQGVANRLIDSNQQITMFNANKKTLASAIGKESLAPEHLFNTLITNGDTTRIKALREILTPEQLQQVKGALLENLIKRNPDGNFDFGTLFRAMRGKKNQLAALFDPEEIQQFGELVKLGERAGPMDLSHSGTGASNSFRNLVSGIGDSLVSRSTLEGLKDSARTRAARPATPMIQASGFQRPVRNNAEETAKLLQILATADGSQKKEEQTASERRILEIARKRLSK